MPRRQQMKTVVALLALLVLVTVSGLARAQDNTYISNQSSRGINAIVSCACSNFVTTAYHIAPGTNQHDLYSDYNTGAKIHIELWVDGAGQHNVEVDFDNGIVAYDNADKSGVDIYRTQSGTLNVAEPGVVITIFQN